MKIQIYDYKAMEWKTVLSEAHDIRVVTSAGIEFDIQGASDHNYGNGDSLWLSIDGIITMIPQAANAIIVKPLKHV